MGAVGTLYRLALADFRERTRRYSFLITLLGTLFFGFLVITGKWTIRLGEYRGEYNSAWVGSLMGSASTCMLALLGFYLVKNSLSRDRRTRVGEILAATPLSDHLYIASKFVSNLAVLTLMAATLAGAAIVMQLLGPVEAGFDLWALTAPFVFLCLPVMTLVAAIAVLFESIRPLRGTLGNILYLFIAQAAIVTSLLTDAPMLDFSGLGMFMPSMQEAALAAYPGAKLGFEMGFVGLVPGTSPATVKLFHWGGVTWSLAMVPLRLLWIGVAVGLAALATLFFDRFDPARAKRAKSATRRERPLPADEDPRSSSVPLVGWSDIGPAEFNFSFLRMWHAELRLMVKGYHWSWYVIAVGLIAVQLTVPYEYARTFAMSAAWIWPLAMWSSMGTAGGPFQYGAARFFVGVSGGAPVSGHVAGWPDGRGPDRWRNDGAGVPGGRGRAPVGTAYWRSLCSDPGPVPRSRERDEETVRGELPDDLVPRRGQPSACSRFSRRDRSLGGGFGPASVLRSIACALAQRLSVSTTADDYGHGLGFASAKTLTT